MANTQMQRKGKDKLREQRMAKSAFLVALLIASALMTACSFDGLLVQKGSGRAFDGTFKLCVTMGENDPRSVGARHFADLVEEYSHGRLHCDVAMGSVLGSDTDLIKKMAHDTGEVDIIVVSSAFFSESLGMHQFEIAGMPYLLTDFETAWAFSDSSIMRHFEEELPDHNMRVLANFCGGFRCITNSKRPIRTPSDLSGLVIRTPSGSVVMDMLFELDAKAMPLPFAELNDALKKGYYDGQENPPSIIYNNGLYEAQEYLSITNHTYMMQSFTIAESIWQQLSEEDRLIVTRAAEEAKVAERKLVEDETTECIDKLIEAGMEVNYPDLELFEEATEDLRMQKSQRYKDEYMQVKNWLEEYQANSRWRDER